MMTAIPKEVTIAIPKAAKSVGEAYSQVVKEYGEEVALVVFVGFGMSALDHAAQAHRELLPLILKAAGKEKKPCPPKPSA